MKTHSHWATQAGYSEDAGAAPAALVQGMGMGCPFLWATRNWDKREEFYNNCILYSTCFFWRCFFTSPNMDELNIIEASDHSDQQKMGGIRSTIIWIHSPIFKHGNIPNLLWQESSSLGIPCFEILGSLLIKPDSSWHLSNLPSWAKKTPGAWRYHAGNTRINLEMGGIR